MYGGQPLPPDFRQRATLSLYFLLFVVSSSVSAFLSVVVCLSSSSRKGLGLGLVFKGLLVGLIYGSHYLFTTRWVLKFPIVQVNQPFPCFYYLSVGVFVHHYKT